MNTHCSICHKPESDHHEFSPYIVPDGCKCDVTTWAGPGLPPICKSFTPLSEQEPDYCKTCEHDRACHGPLPAEGDGAGGG